MRKFFCLLGVLSIGLVSASIAVATNIGAGSSQPSLLFYQNTLDQAPSIDTNTLAAGPTVSGYVGATAGAFRNIRADGDDDLMWYADTLGNLRSIVISTGAEGTKTVPDSMINGANPGADRHFSIDPVENILYVSITDDTVQIIDTDSMLSLGSIGSEHFNGAAAGAFRHTAIDPVNRLMYYASTDNSIYSFSLDTFAASPTTFNPAGGVAGAFRHLAYDPHTELLWYSRANCSVATLQTGTGPTGPSIPSSNFTECVGAGRIITLSYAAIPEPSTGVLLALGLTGLGARRRRASA